MSFLSPLKTLSIHVKILGTLATGLRGEIKHLIAFRDAFQKRFSREPSSYIVESCAIFHTMEHHWSLRKEVKVLDLEDGVLLVHSVYHREIRHKGVFLLLHSHKF